MKKQKIRYNGGSEYRDFIEGGIICMVSLLEQFAVQLEV